MKPYRIIWIGVVLASAVALLVVGPVAARAPQEDACTRYVAPDGDDSADGTVDAPWGTLQYAVDAASPGDVICAAADTYVMPVDEDLTVTSSGTADQPITLTAPDGPATLQGGIMFAPGASYWRVNGFTISGFRVWGVSLDGNNDDVVLSNLDIGGGEVSIHLTVGDSGEDPYYGPVSQITVMDSVLHDPYYAAIDCTPGPCNDSVFEGLEIYGAGIGGEGSFSADGVSIERGQNIRVADCYIHDIGGDGIDLNSRDQMLGEDAGTIVVTNNRVERQIHNGIKLWRGGEISGNIVWDSGDTALVIERGADYVITGNIFANISEYTYMVTLGYDPFPGETNVELLGNIFFNVDRAGGGTTLYIASEIALIADDNVYFNTARSEDVICTGEDACYNFEQINDGSYFAATGNDEHGLYTDPLFVNEPEGDFALSPGSPAEGLLATTDD